MENPARLLKWPFPHDEQHYWNLLHPHIVFLDLLRTPQGASRSLRHNCCQQSKEKVSDGAQDSCQWHPRTVLVVGVLLVLLPAGRKEKETDRMAIDSAVASSTQPLRRQRCRMNASLQPVLARGQKDRRGSARICFFPWFQYWIPMVLLLQTRVAKHSCAAGRITVSEIRHQHTSIGSMFSC
jgi:hypothetical protein